MFKPGLVSEIPEKMKAPRENNKPTQDEMIAIMSAIIEGHEQINDDFGSMERARKKSEAINRWMASVPAIPSTLTAFTRGTQVFITDVRNMATCHD